LENYSGKLPGEDGVATGQTDVWSSIHNRDNMRTDEGQLARGQGRMTLLSKHAKSSGSEIVEQVAYERKLQTDLLLAAHIFQVIAAAGLRRENGRVCEQVPKTGARLLLTTSKALPQKPHIDLALTAVPFVAPPMSGGAATEGGPDGAGGGEALSSRPSPSADAESSPCLLPPPSQPGQSRAGGADVVGAEDGAVLTQFEDGSSQSLLPPATPPPAAPDAGVGGAGDTPLRRGRAAPAAEAGSALGPCLSAAPGTSAARSTAAAAAAPPASLGSAHRPGPQRPTVGSGSVVADGPPVYFTTPSVHYFALATRADGIWMRVWPGSAHVFRHVQAGRVEEYAILPELIFIPPYSMAIVRGDQVHARASAADNRQRFGRGTGQTPFTYPHCVRLHMWVQDTSVPLDNAIHLAIPSYVFRD